MSPATLDPAAAPKTAGSASAAATKTPTRRRATAAPAKKARPVARSAGTAPDIEDGSGHTTPAADVNRAATTSETGRSATQINFRADTETKAALEELTADGTTVSEVIRNAIKSALRAARKAQAIAEMEAIMADPEQRAISEQVYRDMSDLSAW